MIFLNLRPETGCFLAQTPQWFPLPERQSPHFLAWYERPPESGTDRTYGLIPSLSHSSFASYTISDCLLFSPDHLRLYSHPLSYRKNVYSVPNPAPLVNLPGPSPHPKLTILSQRNWDRLLDHDYSIVYMSVHYTNLLLKIRATLGYRPLLLSICQQPSTCHHKQKYYHS